jgi:hypothetical protein
MAELTIKAGNTYPYIESTLEKLNPATNKMEAINLNTGGPGGVKAKKVKMLWRKTGKPAKERTCEFPEPATGKVICKQLAADFEEAGEYEVEWEIEWESAPATFESVPNEGVNSISVQPII